MKMRIMQGEEKREGHHEEKVLPHPLFSRLRLSLLAYYNLD